MRISIVVLVGIPAVGKTQFTSCLQVENYHTKFIHVNYDKLLPRDWNSTNVCWKDERKKILNDVDSFIELATTSTAPFKNPWDTSCNFPDDHIVVVIDDNMYFRSMRLPYYRLAEKNSCGFLQVFFKSSLENALLLNSSRPIEQYVPESIIKTMLEDLDEPNPKENPWELNTLIVNSPLDFRDVKNGFFQLLERAFDNPVRAPAPRPASAPFHQSVVHEADIVLRKLVSEYIQGAKAEKKDLAVMSKRLIRVKEDVLENIKTGEIGVTSGDSLADSVKEAFRSALQE